MRNMRGFTLIEVLLALGILSSISIFAISLLSNQLETRNRLTRVNDAQHALDVALAKVFDDMRHIYVLSKADSIAAGLEGRSIKPTLFWRTAGEGSYHFTTQNFHSLVANTPQSNIANVAYTIRKDKEGKREQLIRRFDTDLKENIERADVGTEEVLVPDLKEFKVMFWDGADFSREDWDSNSGDTSGKLPKMAKIKITSYMPEAEGDAQRRELNPGASDERATLSLETVVYLLYSTGQPDLKDPSKDYKWK